MSDYTPDLPELRDAYIATTRIMNAMSGHGGDAAKSGEEFDRGISKVKADALREAADEYATSNREQAHGVTSVLMFMHHRADRIEMGRTMTTWDEKAEDYAVAHHTYEHLSLEEDASHASGFVRGARWQREALLTDEAVERVARAVYENRVAIIEDPEERRSWPAWEEHESSDADSWRAMARIALTAVIGDDT